MFARIIKTLCCLALVSSFNIAFAKTQKFPIPAFAPDQTAYDGKVVYLLSASQKKVYRWSVSSADYLAPLDVGVDQNGTMLAPSKIAVSSTQKRLYLGYATGAIRYIPLSGDPIETAFASTPLGVAGLAAVGKYLLAQDASGAWATHFIFNQSGVLTDSRDWNSYSSEYTWDAKNSRVLYFQDYLSPNNLVYEVIDQTTGKITSSGGAATVNYASNIKPIRLSADNKYVLVGNGNIFKNPALSVAGNLGFEVADAVWGADGSLISLQNNSGATRLQKRDANFRLIDQQTYAGTALGVFTSGSKTSVLTIKNGLVTPYSYTANDDSDGDGVKNDLDAFPTDAAASVDADKDGYPDKWNSGRTQKDSTTGLVLDAFPKDAACYLKSQGSGSKCNYNLIVPNFTPQKTISDGSTVYLLSRENKRVYRWSIASATYISPLIVGLNHFGVISAPSAMALSTDGSRLYLGYNSGDIQSITLKTDTTEKPFATVPFEVNLLADAGKYLLAQQNESSGMRYTLNANGLAVEKSNWVNTSRYDWDSTSSRAYSLNGNLGYEQIDQASGKVTATERTFDYVGSSFVRVSVNGKFILVSNGQIFNKTNLTLNSSLGFSLADAIWLADGSLVTITQGEGITTLQRRNPAMEVLEQLTYAGTPLGIFGTAAKMSVVVSKDNTVTTYSYVPNNDTDGDGVPNNLDAFPTDAAASVDSDRDGYPDSWNSGRRQSDSTTGLVLDAYPKDTACYTAAHGVNGVCNYAATVPNYIPDQVVSHNGVIYLLSRANKRVYRWSVAQAGYIDPLVVSINFLGEILPPTKMAISAAHNRLYLGYSNGAVHYIALDGVNEQPFASVGTGVSGLAAVGNYVLVEDSSGAWQTHSIFAASGSLQDSKDWNYYSREYAWDPVNSRVYFFRDDTSPNDLHFEVIDQTTGKISSAGETPYHGDYNIMPPIRVTADGQRVLLGSGDIYNADGLTWAGSLGVSIVDAKWLADGSLISLSGANGTTRVQRRNSDFQILEQLSFNGNPVGIYGTAEKMIVVVIKDGTVATYIYIPNDDSDNDGVANTEDAFPTDAAASVDSDRDGHPDAWNPGHNESDSTTGLTLDTYPQDSACFDESQGSGGVCDYNAAVPAFVPDQVASDGDIIYFLSTTNKRIYRWSIANNAYVNPLVVGLDQGDSVLVPTTMAVSAAQNRLYLGYNSGIVTYIALDGAAEHLFATTAMPVYGLAIAGNYVLAQDFSGAWATHYIFDQAGKITAKADWNYYSRVYTWDPVTSRVYFFRDTTTPNDLHYEVIDQTTGAITSAGETPYHDDYSITPPIRVSADGQRVLLGSGDIYHSDGLTWAGSLGASFVDAKWLADGSLVTLRSSNGSTNLQRRNASSQIVEQVNFVGYAVGVYGSANKMVIAVIKDGTVATYNYVPNDDSDNDGVVNTADAFPLDPAASVDSDRDGHPDSWNAGYTQSDSTTGLTLDAYPQDAACFDTSQGNGGVCDYNAAVPGFTPDQIESDGETIYLLSAANLRIYRWSIANNAYMNPLVVGLNQGDSQLAPTKMTLSLAHNRIYLGYGTGAITYIEMGDVVEQPFANTAMSVNGLVAVGKFLLAQDPSGAWATHYIFAQDGNLVASRTWNYYSHEYAWDSVNSRVYFFRDDTSPNDLLYEVINQDTGAISGTGETPYHGDYPIFGAIRVSGDGSKILLGSGDIYNGSDLRLANRLGVNLIDARWVGPVLATAESGGLVKVRDANSLQELSSIQLEGDIVKLIASGDDLVVIRSVSGVLNYTTIPLGDHDGDGLPKWWEDLYGLSDSDSADALLDGDSDGLNTLAEFAQLTNPNAPDTDNDGLTDGVEVNAYHSSPLKIDTDGDGLSDGQEVNTYATSPTSSDTDLDGFNDNEEINVYNTDPNDVNSRPAEMTTMDQSFELNSLPANWSTAPSSQADWYIDSSTAFAGAKSLRSGDIGDSGQSGIRFSTVFAAGTLQFYAKVDAESCCDKLYFYVDGTLVRTIAQWDAANWAAFSVNLTTGAHVLEWRYQKDSSVSTANDSVWIDKVTYTSQ